MNPALLLSSLRRIAANNMCPFCLKYNESGFPIVALDHRIFLCRECSVVYASLGFHVVDSSVSDLSLSDSESLLRYCGGGNDVFWSNWMVGCPPLSSSRGCRTEETLLRLLREILVEQRYRVDRKSDPSSLYRLPLSAVPLEYFAHLGSNPWSASPSSSCQPLPQDASGAGESVNAPQKLVKSAPASSPASVAALPAPAPSPSASGGRCGSSDSEAYQWKIKFNTLKMDYTQLKRSLESKDEQIVRLTQEKQSIQSEHEQMLSSLNNALETKIKFVEDAYRDRNDEQEEFERLKSENAELLGETRSQGDRIAELEGRLDAFGRLTLKEQYSTVLESLTVRIQDEVASLYESQLREAELREDKLVLGLTTVDELQEENESLRRQLESSLQESEQLSQEIQDMRKELTYLKSPPLKRRRNALSKPASSASQPPESQLQQRRLDDQIRVLQQENTMLKTRMNSLPGNPQMSHLLESLESENERLRLQFNCAEKESEEKHKELELYYSSRLNELHAERPTPVKTTRLGCLPSSRDTSPPPPSSPSSSSLRAIGIGESGRRGSVSPPPPFAPSSVPASSAAAPSAPLDVLKLKESTRSEIRSSLQQMIHDLESEVVSSGCIVESRLMELASFSSDVLDPSSVQSLLRAVSQAELHAFQSALNELLQSLGDESESESRVIPAASSPGVSQFDAAFGTRLGDFLSKLISRYESSVGEVGRQCQQEIEIPLKREIANLQSRLQKLEEELSSSVRALSAKTEELQSREIQFTSDISRAREPLMQEIIRWKDLFYLEKQMSHRLQNELIDLKGNIRVFCRVRPLLSRETLTENLKISCDSNLITFKMQRLDHNYEFDAVFNPESTQLQVFEGVIPYLDSVLNGSNLCIFAYGQTGTGKTYTMEGPHDNRGVNYRAIEYLFQRSHRLNNVSFSFQLNVLEVYNENVIDLLSGPKTDQTKSLSLRMGKDGVYVQNLSSVFITSYEDAIEKLERASQNRSVGTHLLNETSSRSHQIVTFIVTSTDLESKRVSPSVTCVPPLPQNTLSRLNLIDLAGSERLNRTGIQGDSITEAQNINKSLSALGDVINSLRNRYDHIPYRNSKLTFLLYNSLSSDSKVLMFANVSPTFVDFDETQSTLGFASRCRETELNTKLRAPRPKPVHPVHQPLSARLTPQNTPRQGPVPANGPPKVSQTPRKTRKELMSSRIIELDKSEPRDFSSVNRREGRLEGPSRSNPSSRSSTPTHERPYDAQKDKVRLRDPLIRRRPEKSASSNSDYLRPSHAKDGHDVIETFKMPSQTSSQTSLHTPKRKRMSTGSASTKHAITKSQTPRARKS